MPCACLLPPEIYPDASEWGPPLWTVLHAVAEKAGRGPFPQFEPEERLGLLRMMQALGKMIPCPSCKEHYDVYLKEHPVEQALRELPYEDLNKYVKTWFWELHNWVNESHGKPLFSYDSLTPAYKSVNIRQTLRQFDVPMQRAIRVRGGQLLGYKEFTKWVTQLCSIYGC